MERTCEKTSGGTISSLEHKRRLNSSKLRDLRRSPVSQASAGIERGSMYARNTIYAQSDNSNSNVHAVAIVILINIRGTSAGGLHLRPEIRAC